MQSWAHGGSVHSETQGFSNLLLSAACFPFPRSPHDPVDCCGSSHFLLTPGSRREKRVWSFFYKEPAWKLPCLTHFISLARTYFISLARDMQSLMLWACAQLRRKGRMAIGVLNQGSLPEWSLFLFLFSVKFSSVNTMTAKQSLSAIGFIG